jgi:hypothetical protein
MMGDREELLRLAYIKLMDAVELLQSIGEDLLADQAEAVAAKVGRAALAAARPSSKTRGPWPRDPLQNHSRPGDNTVVRYALLATGDRL